jgi:hypothetical protein
MYKYYDFELYEQGFLKRNIKINISDLKSYNDGNAPIGIYMVFNNLFNSLMKYDPVIEKKDHDSGFNINVFYDSVDF